MLEEGGDNRPPDHRSISRLVALKPRQVLLAEQKQQKHQPRLTMTKKHLKEQEERACGTLVKVAVGDEGDVPIEIDGKKKKMKKKNEENDESVKSSASEIKKDKEVIDKKKKKRSKLASESHDEKGTQENSLVKVAVGDEGDVLTEIDGEKKKKKKKNEENDESAKSSTSEVKMDDSIKEVIDKKRKKKSKLASESHDKRGTQENALVKVAVGDEGDVPTEIDSKKKKKKKKNKENDESVKSSASEVKKDDSIKEVIDKKEKKKSKLSYESYDEKGTQENSLPVVTEENVVDRGADATNISLDTNKAEPIDRKRKKKISVSEKQSDSGVGVFDKEKSQDTLDNGTGNKSKKRKRSASDESKDKHVDGVVAEESKKRKTGGAGEAEINVQQAEVETVQGGEAKEDNGSVSLMKLQKPFVKQTDEREKGNLVNNGVEKSSEKKIAKKYRNGSAEPKTVNAFQRVKVDEVEFADDRLQDNSYWAKGGAENGYGAKAQEVLGQVKGRGFRHEKTKKKRGSYRGGQIDLQSHSVKFNYSDEE